ncbi:MAG: hypothetical protein Q8936_01195 [Bacillota bacterium]|nr:hypothetical protein [Bacillota bacterium]
MYYKLKLKEYLILLVLIVAGYIFTVSQKYYIPEKLRPFTLLIAVILIFICFFYIVKPKTIFKLSRYLSLLCGLIIGIIIIIQHIIISFDITYKAGIIFIVTIVCPFISGLIYNLIVRRKHNE